MGLLRKIGTYMLNNIKSNSFTNKPLSFGLLKISAEPDDSSQMEKLKKMYVNNLMEQKNGEQRFLQKAPSAFWKNGECPKGNYILQVSPLKGNSYYLGFVPSVITPDSSELALNLEKNFAKAVHQKEGLVITPVKNNSIQEFKNELAVEKLKKQALKKMYKIYKKQIN